MIRRLLSLSLAGLIVLTLSAGCTFRPVRLGPERGVNYDPAHGRAVSGRACGFMLGGFIPIGMSDRDERALRVLTEQAQGQYLAEVQAEQHNTYAFVGWSICTTFHGTAYPRL